MTDKHRKYFFAKLAADEALQAYHGHPEYMHCGRLLDEARERIDAQIERLQKERRQAYKTFDGRVKTSKALEEIRTQRVVPAQQAEAAAQEALYALGYRYEASAHLFGYQAFMKWCRDEGYVTWDAERGDLVNDKGRQAIAEFEAAQ